MDKNNVTEKFAAIFEEYSDYSWHLEVVALVDYDEEKKDYTIKEGIYKDYSKKDFREINGSPYFIYTNGNTLEIDEKEVEKAIYIFDNDFLKNLQIDNNFSFFRTCYYLTLKLERICLEVKNSTTLFSNDEVLSLYLYDHEEEVFKMLYGDTKDFKDCKDTGCLNEIDLEIDSKSDINSLDALKSLLAGSSFMPLFFEIAIPNSNDKQNSKSNSSNLEQEKGLGNINVNEIIAEINAKIVGQNRAVSTLVANIYHNQLLIDELSKNRKIDPLELDSRKITILIDGSTGTGKTAIEKDVASKFDLPIVINSANNFSETGYIGASITDILVKLLRQANGDLKKAERGIIVLDEVDKLAMSEKIIGRDMKQGVQEELLGFISGGEYDIQYGKNVVTFDTSKITFILSGAFTDIREKKIKENEQSKIGFDSGSEQKAERTYQITTEDYIEYGLKREFFGRIKVLTSTRTYLEEDLKNILLTSEISPLKNFEKTVEMYGYKGIIYSEEFIDKVAKEAYEMNSGARALQSIMSGIQNNMLLDLMNNVYDLEKPIELTTDLINEYKKVNIIKY